MNKKIKALLTAAMMCVSAAGSVSVPMAGETETFTADAASFSYPVQEFRMGIGDTNRNVNTSEAEAGAPVTSDKQNGEGSEKWYLNYISSGVYEIVNSETGYLLTNDGGYCTIAADTDASNQRWNITAVEQDFEGYDLYYKITSNADSALALTFTPDTNSFSAEAYSGNIYQKYKLNLDGLEGFAANAKVDGGEKAGTIGGLLGETVTVTNKDDFITQLNKTEPLTIVVNGNFDMQEDWHTRIRDDKTIVGSYSANTLQDCYLRTNNEYGTEGDNPSDNIVIRNIHFLAKNVEDRILVNIWSSRQIMIDHCTFTSQLNRNRDEVGKFIWINTPYESYMDAKDNGRSPDYITISNCKFINRFWTVAYGTQNSEITRCRTTLCYNWWENCARRCPQIGNGIGHIYNNYYSFSGSEGSAQIIGGDGSNMVSENCMFEVESGSLIEGGGSSTSLYTDYGSYKAATIGGSASAYNFSSKYAATLVPKNHYGYSLTAASGTLGAKPYCQTYSGCFDSEGEIKFITDSDMSNWIMTTYESPFLKDITCGELAAGQPATILHTANTYSFKNVGSGLYLTAKDGVADAGTDVIQSAKTNEAASSWTIRESGNGDGYYYILSKLGDGSTYFLDVANGSADNGANIGIWTDTACDAQLFKFVDNGDGTFRIATKVTKDSGVLGIVAGSTDDGASSVQWKYDSSANQQWIIEANGTLFRNLNVKDIAAIDGWYIDDSIAAGDLVYGDRDAVFTTLPESLAGLEAIITGCDSKNNTGDLAVFTAGADMTLYVGFDSRVATKPAWISDYTATPLTALSSKSVTYEFWSVEVEEGETVTLGTNGQSATCVNYVVFAEEKQKIIETTTTTVTTTTTTTTTATAVTTTEPVEETTQPDADIVWGDANQTGVVEVADAIAIMAYAANPEANPLDETQQLYADVYQHGDGVGISDAVSIQKYLTRLLSSLPESYMQP